MPDLGFLNNLLHSFVGISSGDFSDSSRSLAFSTAQKHLQIASLLDPEDMVEQAKPEVRDPVE